MTFASPLALNLLHALQIHPRIPWTDLAVVLDVDPSSLSRKWKQLTRERVAWLSFLPPRQLSGGGAQLDGLAALRIPASGAPLFASRVRGTGRVIDAAMTSGASNFFLRVGGARMSEFDLGDLLQSARELAGSSVTLRPVRRDLFTASMWRLNALSAKQQEMVRQFRDQRYPRNAEKRGGQKYLEDEQQALLLLAADPRVSASELAATVGCSVSTASKILRRVVASNLRAFRVDLSHEAFGWRYLVSTLLDVPLSELKEVGGFLSRFPNLVREVSELVGIENLYFQAWSKNLEMIDEIDSLIQRRFPKARIADRWITVRQLKLGGVSIGADGALDLDAPARSGPRGEG